MIPMKLLSLKENGHNDGKYDKRNHLLYYFKLNKTERPATFDEAQAVGWYLAQIFEKRDAPRKEYHENERPIATDTGLL